MVEYQFDGMKRKLLATVMMAGLLGACSNDVTRFEDDPFQNPFRSRTSFDPVSTNSINRNGAAQAQGPLAPVGNGNATTQALPPPNQPILGGNPAAAKAPLTTGSVGSANYPPLANAPARPSSVVGASNGWTAVGGTPVTLRQGETLNTLSTRYNVPVSALMAVNGISNVNQARPGQQIMIPAYNAVAASKGGASAPTTSALIQRPGPVAQSLPKANAQSAAILPPKPVKVQAPARVEAPVRVAAKARNVSASNESEVEKRAAARLREMKAPKSKEITSTAADKRAEAASKAAKIVAARKVGGEDDRLTTASVSEPRAFAKAAPEPEAAPTASEVADGSFRWPAKGRVISGFGARGTGGANDGINIALPEGTPVRAAEGGTVVHADDALKGYGKLVLIRHPNGYVSVYAHNGELNVKRGENVKRGQVIAKSGQSGNVTAPQLHFEIRKGASPVDPTKYLGE